MRWFPRTLRFVVALGLLVYWSGLQAAPAFAGLAPSEPTGITTVAGTRDADLLIVQRALEHRVVAQKLRDYGVRPDEVKLRLASLSDQDLHTLASASKGLPSGGDDAIGLLIGLLIVVLLVIVILKLLNKEVIVR
jgi:hypothetical protein